MWQRIFRSEFIRNSLTLVSGNTIAQLIPLLAEPVLTRMFPPEDFGLLALFISISSLFAVIATGRYELALMLPKKEVDALNIIGVSFLVTISMAAFSLFFVWAFNRPICYLLDSQKISNYLYMVPLVVLFTGLTQTFNYWFTRKKHFRKVSAARIAQSSTAAGTGIGTGFMKAGSIGLIAAHVSGSVISAIYFIYKFLISDRKKIRLITRSKMRSMAKHYAEFPRINALYIFTDTLQYSGISFLISYYFNNILLGLYSRTFRILTVPLSFIGSAISHVYYQKASELYNNNGDLRKFSLQILLGSAIVGLPIFIAMILWGPDVFAFVLGDSWREAGVYAQILSPWIFMKFVSQPLTQLPMIMNKQKQLLLFNLISIMLIFGSLVYGGIVANSLILGFYLISITQIIFLSFFIYWLIKLTRKEAEL